MLIVQSCPILCDPMDCSPPGSSVHGIFQAGIPCPSPGDLPNPGIEPGSPTWQAVSLPTEPPGKPCPNLVLGVFMEPYIASVVNSSVGKSVSCFH